MIIHVSQSIKNWEDKILKRHSATSYRWYRDLYKPVTFFGLYRPEDFLLFFIHRGKKSVHWQGSDILGAGWHYRWLSKINATHICENEVEQGVLRLMLQQEIKVVPTFLSNPNDYEISYKQSETPEVWIHVNKNAELESGMGLVELCARRVPEVRFHVYGKVEKRTGQDNIVYHGFVDEKTFDKEIKNYQAGIRLHEFDGFSEVISKSALMGQHAISRIRYPHIDTYKDEQELIALLKDLKNKKEPNHKARECYIKAFSHHGRPS